MDDGFLGREETAEFFAIMARSRRRRLFRRTEVSMGRALQFLAGDGRPYRCTAAKSQIAVMPNGDLFPCRRLPLVAGNLFCDPLERLYREAPLFRELRRLSPPETCGVCLYREACRGGLRCLAHAVTGSYLVADPGCPMASFEISPKE